jgi:predicted AlkP superfamily pyrophosphatase or phosphodiesterase
MINKYIKLLLAFIFVFTSLFAQKNKSTTQSQPNTKPKLVVGLVVDQMRWDFLYRYQSMYGKGGFKRLLGEGFSCENTMITHLPTYTAVGHTGVYTGAFPSIHGIVGNNWRDGKTGKKVYCTDDSTVSGVGGNNESGKMSPKNLQVNTIADEMKLSNEFKSKTFGVSLKDRGAILPAGHSADAAYWYDDKTGNWISSTYYMNQLPGWVESYNQKRLPDEWMKKDWETFLPVNNYIQSTIDNADYEGSIPGEKNHAFPHELHNISDKKYSALRYTPHGNALTIDFAKQIISNEKLGKDEYTDLLAISLSSPDYAGHTFGPNSVEIEDMYLRLDSELSMMLNFLDSAVGKGKYLFFLTADHGVSQIPEYLNSHRIPAGRVDTKSLQKEINDTIYSRFKIQDAIVEIENSQLYLNPSLKQEGGMNAFFVSQEVIKFLYEKPFVQHVADIQHITSFTLPIKLTKLISDSYFPGRSGDLQMFFKPNFIDGGKTGTTHGAWNPYDAHIPLVWFGAGIKEGKSYEQTQMADIAPTLAAMLQIQTPNGTMGMVIEALFK